MDLIKRFSALLVLVVILHSCSEPSLRPEKINFNKNWQFVRLNEETANRVETKNQGSNWSSQYNVTNTSISVKLAVSEKELKKEFWELQVTQLNITIFRHFLLSSDFR
ncbi:MAG: hypothetical protein GXO89_07880 [Chlorobi bacterium]|nr:hypothetical protein [Chlorobiota bacterium]